MLTEELSWVAVMTYPQAEFTAARALEEAGVEVYLPLLRGRDKRCKSGKMPEKPMFPCYIFARINKYQIYKTRTDRGVVNIVSLNHSATVVPQRDIDNVRAFEATQRNIFIHDSSKLVKGADVTIKSGEFAGMQGRLVRGCKDGNFAVNIDVMHVSFVVHIKRDELALAEREEGMEIKNEK